MHAKTAGMTQTQPEPSMFVRVKVDGDDKVVDYVVGDAGGQPHALSRFCDLFAFPLSPPPHP